MIKLIIKKEEKMFENFQQLLEEVKKNATEDKNKR